MNILTYLYFNPRNLTTIQDATTMLIKIHFTGYRAAHLQIYKWLMYTYYKPKDTRKKIKKINI